MLHLPRCSAPLMAALAVTGFAGTANAKAAHHHPVTAKTAIAELEVVEKRQLAAFLAHDLEGSVAPYADDAILVGPGQPRVEGKANIRAALAALFGDKAFAMTVQPIRHWVSAQGDMISLFGTFDMTVTDPATGKPTTLGASNHTLWKKDSSGNWKIAMDFNGFGGGAPKP